MDEKELNRIMFITKNLTVLIAEDDETALGMYKQAVEPFFKEVKTAADGKKAYEIYSDKENQVDIIVTDINMPHLNGLELIKKIRSANQTIPIIVASAYANSDSFVKFIEAGISSFLPKPLSVEALFHCAYAAAIKVDDARLILEYQQKLEEQVYEYMKEIDTLKKENLAIKQGSVAEVVSVGGNVASVNEPGASKDKYFEKISKFDKNEFGDAVLHMQNHQAFITNQDSTADRARLSCVILEMHTILTIIHKIPLFANLSAGFEQLWTYLVGDKNSVLANREPLEKFIAKLERFYLDIIAQESATPNCYDDEILELAKNIRNLGENAVI
jgi:CheY-like chemotaxis protein